MAESPPAVDAFPKIVGVSTAERESSVLSARATNMDFRNGIRPRHGLFGMTVVFENPDRDKETFQKGNCQGIFGYQSNAFRPSGLMIVIAGNIYFAAISGRFLYVKRLYTGWNPNLMECWGVQGFNLFILSNGLDNCVIFDGYSPVAIESNPAIGQIPVCTALEFIHHRIAICSPDGQSQVAISNLWTASQTNAITFFTEGTVWNNAGVFRLHSNISPLIGFAVVPRDKRTPNGQGELLMLGSSGAQTLNIQLPRGEWLDSQIQDTANLHGGLAADHGYLMWNGALYFISHDGIRRWSPTAVDSATGSRDVLISGDVQEYWHNSDPNNRRFLCAGAHDSKLFFGVNPVVEDTEKWGRRKYCSAWLTLDTAFRTSGGQQLPLSWDGLQSGIRPVAYVSNLRVHDVSRSYVMSYDADGQNRIYEVTNFLKDDLVDGTARRVRWSVDFPPSGADGRGGVFLKPKKPRNLRVDFTNAEGEVSVAASYRQTASFCLEPWGSFTACGPPMETCLTRRMHYGRKNFLTPPLPELCQPSAAQYHIRLNGVGPMEITNLITGLEITPNGDIFMRTETTCGSCDDQTGAKGVLCCEDFNTYQAVEQPPTC